MVDDLVKIAYPLHDSETITDEFCVLSGVWCQKFVKTNPQPRLSH